MNDFNTALTTHFKRYLNTLSVPLADQAVFGKTPAAQTCLSKTAAQLTQAMQAQPHGALYVWQQAVSGLQQAQQPPLSPWQGALAWQTALGRLQQGLSGEEILLPENLLALEDADELLDLPAMPESDMDLFNFGDPQSSALDSLFADTAPVAEVAVATVTEEETAVSSEDSVEPEMAEVIEEAAETDVDTAIDAVIENLAQEANADTVADIEIPEDSPAFIEDGDDEMHIHVAAGQQQAAQAETLLAQAPPMAVNPILAATQQALQTAAAQAAAQPAQSVQLDPTQLSSSEYFSRLPWLGMNSAP